MEDYLTQIELALQHNLYLIALSNALSLPDICGALNSEDNKASGKKYEAWYNKYAFGKCSTHLDGHSCYKFRCSLLHQGSTQDSSEYNKSKFSRILFLEPSKNSPFCFHDNIFGSNNELVLNIDVITFCKGMITAVREWYEEVNSIEPFISNYNNFVKRYPTGLSPYITGLPVIS